MPTSDYRRIEETIHFLRDHFREQPSLEEIARGIGLSEFHFQRLFKRWAGISPKRFLQFLMLGHAKDLLKESRSILDTAYEAGLSSPARLHDLFISLEGVTPGTYKAAGDGMTMRFGVHESPFGPCFIAATGLGICALSFLAGKDAIDAEAELRGSWPAATIKRDQKFTREIAARVFRARSGSPAKMQLYVQGTNFQVRVWEALLRIPEGNVLSYEDVATLAGVPDATRAVANAVAHNPVAYLIPCHRVIRKAGVLGGYRWGTERKQAILALESARTRATQYASVA